jgi:hypothetical protein
MSSVECGIGDETEEDDAAFVISHSAFHIHSVLRERA